jgi:hypothetical protein
MPFDFIFHVCTFDLDSCDFVQKLSVTDDTVLEHHMVDPFLIQLKLIEENRTYQQSFLLSKSTSNIDFVSTFARQKVDAILRGEKTKITARRRNLNKAKAEDSKGFTPKTSESFERLIGI